jgi:predicted dehydrogenase
MRLGLIGLKGHQSVVLAGAKKLGDFEVVAVADDSKPDLDRFKQREPLAKNAELYADWRHLLDHAMLDVVCVCDENGVRTEQLLALAKRNVHVVAEKPLATTLDDLAKLKAAFARSKGRLTMLLTMRHEAQYAKMRELVRGEAVGEVCLATAQKSYQLHTRPEWFKDRKRLGGTIPYIGIHAIDLMRWVTGLDYTHVAAFHACLGKPETKETESQASVLLRMGNGASATARLDYLRPEAAGSHGDDRLRIAGGDGVIEYRGGEKGITLVTGKEKPRTVEAGTTENLFVEFMTAIKEGRPSRIPAEDCFYATEVVLKAREAADGMKLVPV